MFPEFAPLNPGRKYLDKRMWEADERPEPRSLGLLPSGPDPVGEWLVHRQPPGLISAAGRQKASHAETLRSASAVNLKFLSLLTASPVRNFKFKTALES